MKTKISFEFDEEEHGKINVISSIFDQKSAIDEALEMIRNQLEHGDEWDQEFIEYFLGRIRDTLNYDGAR